MGRPIKVRGSCRTTALTESPTRFTARIPIARRRPHFFFCRASPTAAPAHALPTTNMSRTESRVPIFWNPSCASGFNRHTISSPLPGVSSAATVTAQAVAPNAKNATSTFIPTNRRCDMRRFYDIGREKYSRRRSAHRFPAKWAGSPVCRRRHFAGRPPSQKSLARILLFFFSPSLHLLGCGRQHSSAFSSALR
jgi:hypothetical protein